MNWIKSIMKEKGINQIWLIEKLCKFYSQVNGIFQNRTQPHLEVLFDIAKLLEVSPKSLIAENKNK